MPHCGLIRNHYPYSGRVHEQAVRLRCACKPFSTVAVGEAHSASCLTAYPRCVCCLLCDGCTCTPFIPAGGGGPSGSNDKATAQAGDNSAGMCAPCVRDSDVSNIVTSAPSVHTVATCRQSVFTLVQEVQLQGLRACCCKQQWLFWHTLRATEVGVV